ncbi:MAG TPA: TonB-dependent receptor [Caulobacteraceae bacterium]|jgi:catecholate siderophore receptor|nr:TonB-dependent receptor [Caulobacteraceae bacterium]
MTPSNDSRARSLAWQVLGTMALAAGLTSTAQAADKADAPFQMAVNDVTATAVGVIDVVGRGGGLNNETGLSVMPTTLQDTPQAVNVIPQIQLQQQKITSLEQALRNVPGITVSIGEGGALNGDQFRIRGQEAQNDVYLDGLRDFGVYTRDAFNFQEIQVLKGPSGALFGRGTTGGVINTLSKTAHLGDENHVEAAFGSADYYRASADLNHQIGDTSAIRLNVLGSSNHVADRDIVNSKRWGAAASLALGIGTPTQFTLNFLHQHDDRIPDYGIIILQPPGSLIAMPASEYGVPRSNFLGLFTDKDVSNANILTAKFLHKASDYLTVASDSRIGIYDRFFQYSTLDNCSATCLAAFFDGNPATDAFGGYGGSGPYRQNAWGAQNISTARYEGPLFGLKSQLIAGVDLSYQSNKRTFQAYSLPAGYTARNTIPRSIWFPDHVMPAGYAVITPTLANIANSSATATTVTRNLGESTDYGAFLTERLWLLPSVSVIGSVRVDAYRAEFDSVTVAGQFTPLKSKSTLTNPRANLVWEPSQTQTYYLSWGRSATPQGTGIVANATGIAVTSKDLEPEKNESFEAGAKLGFLGGRLTATAAAFYVKKNNATQTDPSTGFLLAQSGERQTVQGVELGLSGRLARGWTVNAAYAYVDSRIKESYTACSATTIPCPAGAAASTPVLNTFVIGRQVLLTPKNSGSVFTNYEFDGGLRGLSINGGVSFQDGFPTGYTVSTAAPAPAALTKIAYVPHTLSFDAGVAYEVGRYRVALNATNLTDRLNYTQVFSNRAVPAPGRTVIGTVGVKF